MKLFKNLKSKKGFTLLEIIIVLVIISLLAVVLYPKLKGREDAAKITAAFVEINRIQEASKAYCANTGAKTYQGITNAVLTNAGVIDATQLTSVFGSGYTVTGNNINLTVTVTVQNTNNDAQVCAMLASKFTNAGITASCAGAVLTVTFVF